MRFRPPHTRCRWTDSRLYSSRAGALVVTVSVSVAAVVPLMVTLGVARQQVQGRSAADRAGESDGSGEAACRRDIHHRGAGSSFGDRNGRGRGPQREGTAPAAAGDRDRVVVGVSAVGDHRRGTGDGNGCLCGRAL